MKATYSLLACALALACVAGNERASATKAPPKRGAVETLLAEMQLPSIKGAREEFDPAKLLENHSFTDDGLKDYRDSEPTFDDIQNAPEKFEKEFPVRHAVVRAVIVLRNLERNLPDELRSPITDLFKVKITRNYQRTIATMQGKLEEVSEELAEASKQRDLEISKRWQAQFDYIRAQVHLRLAWYYEYNMALSRAKQDKVADLDPDAGHNGWRLVMREKMSSSKEIRDMAQEAKDTLAQLAIDYPKTPWALVAEKLKEMPLGLEWQPVKLK